MDHLNWLAHLRLAPADPLLRIGNLCGDFVRGVDVAELHPKIQLGIAHHRAIDRFVDAHPITKRSCERLRSKYRFAAVLVDVFYDHFLARDWGQHGDGRSLRSFVDDVHDLLECHVELLPPRLQQALPAMRREDWLASYGDLSAIDRILERMSGRLRHRSRLADGGLGLRANYEELSMDFKALWPHLEAEAAHIAAGRS